MIGSEVGRDTKMLHVEQVVSSRRNVCKHSDCDGGVMSGVVEQGVGV